MPYGIFVFYSSHLMKSIYSIFTIVFLGINSLLSQGIYAPPAGQIGSTAIHKDSSVFVGWASQCVVTRGLMQYDSASLGVVTQGNDVNGLGIADNITVSLGDSGIAVVTFNGSIYNGPGYDFAIFENAFSETFLELAFVEVSSNGEDFVRFPNYFTYGVTQIGTFGTSDATHIHNLAGKYKVNYGTPFDLSEIPDTSILNKNGITHIKIIDVIGNITLSIFDTDSNPVNDPYPTPFASGGFDLDAVGAIHYIPSVGFDELVKSSVRLYPNPTATNINIDLDVKATFNVYSIQGNLLLTTHEKQINFSAFDSGTYLLHIKTSDQEYVERIFKR